MAQAQDVRDEQILSLLPLFEQYVTTELRERARNLALIARDFVALCQTQGLLSGMRTSEFIAYWGNARLP